VLKLSFCALEAHQLLLHPTLIFTFNFFGVDDYIILKFAINMSPAGGGVFNAFFDRSPLLFAVVGRLTNNSKRFSSPNVLLICRPPESGFGFSLLFA
jgi:hypothetical protein